MFSSSSQALFNAVKIGDIDLVEELISQGADPRSLNTDNETLLHVAIKYGHDQLTVKLIENYTIDVNAGDKDGSTALHKACIEKNFAIVKLLLKKGADINAENWFGTPLYQAICDLNHITGKAKIEELVKILWNHQPKAHLKGYNRNLIFMNLLRLWQKSSNSSFISIDLSDRGITDEDLKELASILKRYPILSKLKLSDNPFTHEGANYLQEILATNKNLKSLDLSYTNIGSNYFFIASGFQKIIRALPKNNTLEHLDVSNCELDKSDIKTLIEFLRDKSNQTLKRIDFNIKDEIFDQLSKEDQDIIRITQNLADFRSIINRCQTRLNQFKPKNDRENELFESIKKCLIQYQEMFSGQEKIDIYLNGVIAGIVEFADVASDNHLIELNYCLQNILYILHLGQMPKEENIRNSIDIFEFTFLNNLNALYKASSTISSHYVKNEIKTPIEKMALMAKNVILGFSGIGKAVEGSSLVLGLAGEHIIDAVSHGAVLVSETAEVAHIMERIHWGLDQTKENLIRKIHGLSERDKIENLVKCFKGSQTATSKIKAICYAITHHYQDIIKELSLNDAEMLAKYAYLHVAHLLTSGLLLRSGHELSAEILSEEAILWLAYVPYNDSAIRVDILTRSQKELAINYFMLPRIKFHADMEEQNLSISSHYENKLYVQNTYPTRFATQAEIASLIQVINMALEFDHTEIVSNNVGIKYQFLFQNSEILELKNNCQLNRIETQLSSYQSKSKRMDKFDERLHALEEIIKKSEEEKKEFIKIIKKQGKEINKLNQKLQNIEIKQNPSSEKDRSSNLSTSNNNLLLWNSKKNPKTNPTQERDHRIKQKKY